MNIWKDRNWSPMLLKEIDKPFDSNEYIFENKFDGIRTICFADINKITLMSRNNVDITYLYPELSNIKDIVKDKVIFDGEIVLFDEGIPSFSKLQERTHLRSAEKIKMASSNNPVVFVAFDIIYENKLDLTNTPLMERKKHLSKYKNTNTFMKTKYIDEYGKLLFKEIKKNNLEGIVAKNKLGLYHINKRTDDFIKIKNIQREKFVIGGFIEKDKNISLLFVGKCSVSKNNPIYKKLEKRKVLKNYFNNLEENINFIKPTIYCYIEYTEKTKNNHLRHPVFKGIV